MVSLNSIVFMFCGIAKMQWNMQKELIPPALHLFVFIFSTYNFIIRYATNIIAICDGHVLVVSCTILCQFTSENKEMNNAIVVRLPSLRKFASNKTILTSIQFRWGRSRCYRWSSKRDLPRVYSSVVIERYGMTPRRSTKSPWLTCVSCLHHVLASTLEHIYEVLRCVMPPCISVSTRMPPVRMSPARWWLRRSYNSMGRWTLGGC